MKGVRNAVRWGVLFLVCASFVALLVEVRGEQNRGIHPFQWARQMAEYCEDLADSFERLESHNKALAKQYRQANQRRLVELHGKLASEHDQVADSLNELRKAYEQLAKELRR
ncbi:hypothetical protein GG496_001741 [Candidatus Fervidibacteria bacterium JGI MDM2 JNZ-1-D12]